MDQTTDKYSFQITWLPFLLRPDMPWEGRKKAKNTKDNPRVGAWLKSVGERAGINFTGKCDVTPNTILGHALLNLAKDEEKVNQDQLSIVLLKAYFTDGKDVANIDNLVNWAGEAGLDKSQVRVYLQDKTERAKEIKEEVRNSVRNYKFSGVPYFSIKKNSTVFFSGAQPADRFKKAFADVTQ